MTDQLTVRLSHRVSSSVRGPHPAERAIERAIPREKLAGAECDYDHTTRMRNVSYRFLSPTEEEERLIREIVGVVVE